MDAEARYWKSKWEDATRMNAALKDALMEVMTMKGKKKAKKGCK